MHKIGQTSVTYIAYSSFLGILKSCLRYKDGPVLDAVSHNYVLFLKDKVPILASYEAKIATSALLDILACD